MKITDQMLRTAAAAICCKANELGCAAKQEGAEFGTCMAGTFLEDARRCFAVIEPDISRLTADLARAEERVRSLQGGAERYWEGRCRDAERERDGLRKVLQGLLHDPEPDHDEPDEDWRVIRKMREAVRAALSTPTVSDADGARG